MVQFLWGTHIKFTPNNQKRTEAGDAAKITLYGRQMPKIVREEAFIPEGSDLPCVEKQAEKNDDGSITLMIASDIHYSTDYTQNNLQVWYDNVEPQVGKIDSFASLGDTGSAYSPTPEVYWENVRHVLDFMDSKVEAGEVGTAVYTFGNHEWYPAAGGDFMNHYENDVSTRMKRMGEAVKTDDYIFYCLGAGAIASKYSQGYSEEDIARVEEYLNSAPTDIPIFILTHFPVHFWGDRKEENADSGYAESYAPVQPGNCYYMNVYDEAHEQVSASFIDLEEFSTEPGNGVTLISPSPVKRGRFDMYLYPCLPAVMVVK